MKIRFVTPPSAKQVGGIEHAVEGLRETLQRQGVSVLQGADPNDEDALHHFHGLWDPEHSRIAARLSRLGRPYVVSPHGMLEPWAFRHRRWKKLPYFWLIERRFLKKAKSLFVTSSMEKKHLSYVLHHPNVEIIPLGCRDFQSPDYEASRDQLGWISNERYILFLSRIDVKKGLDMFIQCAANAGVNWSGWNLVVVGDGDPYYVNQLKVLASTLSDRIPKVDWVGPVWGKDRWRYMQGADLFCLPTHSENFGLVILEALHTGTPVLTTDQTPWAEYSEMDGMFISKPDVASLQHTLLSVLKWAEEDWSCDKRHILSNWAINNFSWDNLVHSYLDAYDRSWVLAHGPND